MTRSAIILASPAANLSGLAVSRIIASDEARASAERMAKEVGDPPVTLMKGLRPWNLDVMHDRTYFVENPNEAPLDGGESFVAFQERALATLLPIFYADKKRESITIVVDESVAKLIDAWVKAGADTTGTVDVSSFAEGEPECVSGLVRQGDMWVRKSEAALRGGDDEKEKTMSDPFAVLGAQVVSEMAASDAVGFDWQKVVSDLATTGENIYKQTEADKAKKKAEAAAQASLSRSIEADAAWASAETNLELAASVPARAAAQVSRDSTAQDAMRAGSALDADRLSKRCEQAQKALKDAAQAASAAPNDAVKQARMRAWQKVASQCSLQYVPDGKGGERLEKRGGSFLDFLTRKHAGLPTWGWGLVTVGSLTILMLIIRALRRKEK